MSRSLPTSKFLTTTITALLASLLFVGCGSNGESSDANATTSSSSTSASSSSSSSQNSSAQPDQSATVSSSEKSTADATNGKYKPADEHGPAQNVPKPVKPEGMDVETPEAMEKFIYYWNDLRNYAVQTGDTTEVRKHTASSFQTYVDNFAVWDGVYRDGGWIAGGLVKPAAGTSGAVSLGDGFYAIPMNYETGDALIVDKGEGEPRYKAYKLSEDNGTGYELKVQFSDSGEWFVIDQKIVGDQ